MPEAQDLYAVVNQQMVPFKDASLHISDLTIQRGYGIFDYFKVRDGHPFFLKDYLVRFYESARHMELTIPLAPEALTNFIQALILKNNLPESGVKMILTGGYSSDGYQPGPPNLLITQHPLVLPTSAQYNSGIKIITQEYVRELPLAKTINYTMGIRLIKKIKANGADDVLYHQNGVVSEFPRCNFFIVKKDNRVVTSAENVLLGVTRKNVLVLAREKYTVAEEPVTLADIFEAKEAFLTSTTKRILPIVQVDDQMIGTGKPGEITLSLLKDLISLEEKDIALGKTR